MNAESVNRLLLPVILAVIGVIAPKVFGAEETKPESTAASSLEPSDVPVGGHPDRPATSAVARLGIKFSPVAKNGENGAASSPVSPDILFLPTLFVEDKRVKLKEKDLLTDDARLELAKKTCLSPLYRFTIGPLAQLATYYFDWPSILSGWHPNDIEAATLYRQEERLKMLEEMDSLIRIDGIHDETNTQQFQRIRFGAVIQTR